MWATAMLTNQAGARLFRMAQETTRPNLTSGRIHLYMGEAEGRAPAWLGLTTRALGAELPVTVVLPPGDSGSQVRKALAALPQAMTSANLTIVEPTANTADAVVRLLEPRSATNASLVVMPLALQTPLMDDLRISLQAHHAACPRPPVEVVISGRQAPEWLVAIADLITELRPGA